MITLELNEQEFKFLMLSIAFAGALLDNEPEQWAIFFKALRIENAKWSVEKATALLAKFEAHPEVMDKIFATDA